MKIRELGLVVGLAALGAAWLQPRAASPRAATSLNLDLPEGVEILRQEGRRAVLRVDMREHTRLDLEVSFDGPARDWAFHLADSMSNNGYGGDAGHSSNDAELALVNGRLEAWASDRMPGGEKHLLRGWPVQGPTLRLQVADGLVQGESGLKLQDPYLFALNGQEDPEGSPNHDLFIGLNQVVAGGRTGSGVCGLKLRFGP